MRLIILGYFVNLYWKFNKMLEIVFRLLYELWFGFIKKWFNFFINKIKGFCVVQFFLEYWRMIRARQLDFRSRETFTKWGLDRMSTLDNRLDKISPYLDYDYVLEKITRKSSGFRTSINNNLGRKGVVTFLNDVVRKQNGKILNNSVSDKLNKSENIIFLDDFRELEMSKLVYVYIKRAEELKKRISIQKCIVIRDLDLADMAYERRWLNYGTGKE